MNLSFSLEKASSFSPVSGPAMLVVLEPAVAEEAVVDSGAAASASRRLSLIVAMLWSQADAGGRETKQVRGFLFLLIAAVTDACQKQMSDRVSSCWLSLSKH